MKKSAGISDRQVQRALARMLDRAVEGSAVTSAGGGKTGSAYCAAWEGERILDGFYTVGRVEAEMGRSQERPGKPSKQFERARYWFENQWFVRSVTLLRCAFYNYGFQVQAVEKKDKEKVKRWDKANARMSRRYARDAWIEWLIQNCVLGVWRTEGGNPPMTWAPEAAKYSDAFGEETLTLIHNFKDAQIGKLSRKEQAALKKKPGELVLTHDDDAAFSFEVLSRQRSGYGLGPPSYLPIFTCSAQLESLEVGMALLAGSMRNVMEQHKMGHEIKSGIHAGSRANMIKKTRVDEFTKATKGKNGSYRIATNFDHNIVAAANWPQDGTNLFDAKWYESGMMRLMNWANPIGPMILGKNLNPFLMNMLRTQAADEREIMKEHLTKVFVEALGAPEGIELRWSDRCFIDPRIAATLISTGLNSGPVSQSTFQEELGLDRDQERERKLEEFGLPKSQTTPIYDGAHGPPKDKGRKPGTRDGDG